jgi:glycosidase
MNKAILFIPAVLFVLFLSMCSEPKKIHNDQPPSWAKEMIWYQIFVERFYNGDPTNDPKPENIRTASDFYRIPDNWSITPWTKNWYELEDWSEDLEGGFYSKLQLRRYGGDLQGVVDKLDYLQDLGITAIYFNPINDAPSLHKYDARNWRHVDVNFGPDPAGDNEIIASEDPVDPSTWKWTSADNLFLELVDELHKRDMRIILDYSWNHTGVEFWAWRDIIKNQENSGFAEWYDVKEFDDPKTVKNEFDYHGWLNLRSLPEIKKVNVTTEREIGHPYEGDLSEGAKRHIFAVTQRWLAPDGDVSKGIDGYRLDVADHVGMVFWRNWRIFVKSINPQAYLVGEIWWEQWPDKLMNPVPYVSGDVFDAVMFYQIYRPARSFFGKMDDEIDAVQFKDSLEFQWNRLEKATRYGMMNTAATHDSPRLVTSFNNSGKYKYNAKPDADPEYKAGKPDEETWQRVKLYLIHQFTNIGAPHIWNGDEMGMWGADDPDCRKPLWWEEFDFEPEFRNNFQEEEEKEVDEIGFNHKIYDFYKKLIRIRKENPVLINGEIEFLMAEGKILIYKRSEYNKEIIVVLNAGTDATEVELTGNESWQDLLTGTVITGSKLQIGALSGMILEPITEE